MNRGNELTEFISEWFINVLTNERLTDASINGLSMAHRYFYR
jgi:hypothetical protein